MKTCKKCGIEKQNSEFTTSARNKDGFLGSCRSCENMRKLAWSSNNPDKVQATKTKYFEKNRDEILARISQWKRNNKAAVSASGAKRYKNNRDKILGYNKTWIRLNKDNARAACHRRRARKRNATGSHTALDIQNLFQLQRGKCACCQTKLVKYHVDHVIPLVKNGSNDKNNLQLLCKSCNHQKHTKDSVIFMQSRGFLI